MYHAFGAASVVLLSHIYIGCIFHKLLKVILALIFATDTSKARNLQIISIHCSTHTIDKFRLRVVNKQINLRIILVFQSCSLFFHFVVLGSIVWHRDFTSSVASVRWIFLAHVDTLRSIKAFNLLSTPIDLMKLLILLIQTLSYLFLIRILCRFPKLSIPLSSTNMGPVHILAHLLPLLWWNILCWKFTTV